MIGGISGWLSTSPGGWCSGPTWTTLDRGQSEMQCAAQAVYAERCVEEQQRGREEQCATCFPVTAPTAGSRAATAAAERDENGAAGRTVLGQRRLPSGAEVQVGAGGLSRRWALGPLSHSPRWDLDAASREDENEEAGCVGLGQHRLPLGCAVVQHRRLDAEDEAQAHLDGDGGVQGEGSFHSHPEARGVNGDSEVQHAEHRAKTDRRVCADGSTGCGSLGQHRLPFGADPIQEGNSQAGTGSKLRGQGRLQHEEHRAETDRRVYADGSTGCGSCGQHRLPSEAEVQVGAGGLSRRWAPGSLSHSPRGALPFDLVEVQLNFEMVRGPLPAGSGCGTLVCGPLPAGSGCGTLVWGPLPAGSGCGSLVWRRRAGRLTLEEARRAATAGHVGSGANGGAFAVATVADSAAEAPRAALARAARSVSVVVRSV